MVIVLIINELFPLLLKDVIVNEIDDLLGLDLFSEEDLNTPLVKALSEHVLAKREKRRQARIKSISDHVTTKLDQRRRVAFLIKCSSNQCSCIAVAC